LERVFLHEEQQLMMSCAGLQPRDSEELLSNEYAVLCVLGVCVYMAGNQYYR